MGFALLSLQLCCVVWCVVLCVVCGVVLCVVLCGVVDVFGVLERCELRGGRRRDVRGSRNWEEESKT